MPPTPPEVGSPTDWLRHARSDLALARVERPAEVFLEMLCFHAQQAVEKSIKAVLLANEIHFPYTHDVAKLISLVKEAGIPWPEGLDQAADLTEYASETRYPGSVEPVSEEDYRQAVAIAEQILTWSASIIEEAA
jgi:HEPN domain-containing protein